MAFELFTWAAPACIFISIYCLKFNAKTTVVPAYVLNLLTIWMGIFAIRLANWLFFKAYRENSFPNAAIEIIASLLITIPLTAIYVWQIAIIASLFAWNTIITLDVASPYIKNFLIFKGTLELPSWLLLSALAIFLTLQVLMYKKIKKFDISFKVKDISTSKKTALLIALSLIFLIQISRLCNQEQIHPQEPIGLSLFGAYSSKLQSHDIKENPILEKLEEKSRASYTKNVRSESRNLILFVGDALRSDHMSIYGYQKDTTPLLEKLAQSNQTLLVKGTRSTCAESTCGILSIIASRPLRFMPRNPITLHEVLHINGYRTILILSGDHTNFYGLKKLYGAVDEYHDGTDTEAYINDDESVIEKIRSLPPFDKSQPVMLHFHLMSAHGLGARKKENIKYQPSSSYYTWKSSIKKEELFEESTENAKNYYDNGVAQLDSTISRILHMLKEKGYLENTTVAITGDHGEMLGEHAHFGHQRTVEEGVLSIPFIIQRYGYKEKTLGDWRVTSQTDIAPTLLEELKIPAPSVWQGIALQKRAQPRTTHFQQEHQVGIYWKSPTELIKYWKNEKTQEEFAYRIDQDKLETENIIKSVPKSLLTIWRQEIIKTNTDQNLIRSK